MFMQRERVNEDATLDRSPSAEPSSGVGPGPGPCLSEDEVLALCAGELAAADLPRVDEHLDQCIECQHCVTEAFAQGQTRPAEDTDNAHPGVFRSGMMAAGRFRIARFLKRGGMGEVYEAFDTVLEAPVALKTIVSTACDSPRAVRKLKAEVQLARSIRHPNVCSVFDFCEHRPNDAEAGAVYFFTMEFIDGETLAQRLKRERPALPVVLRLARLQLLGLNAAHANGVVHRDFKSENVMLRKDPEAASEVVVMDFGLARALRAEHGAPSTDSEQFAGSVAYMAPEQVEGRRHIGREADIYAFGVVLFEMLTGQLPFGGDSPWTIATRRLTERPPVPSRLAPGLPPALDAFVLRCMSRLPADRFEDARAALAHFDALSLPGARAPSRRMAIAGLAATLMATAAYVNQRGASPSSASPAARAEPERVTSVGALRDNGQRQRDAAPVSRSAPVAEPPGTVTVREERAAADAPRAPAVPAEVALSARKPPLATKRRDPEPRQPERRDLEPRDPESRAGNGAARDATASQRPSSTRSLDDPAPLPAARELGETRAPGVPATLRGFE